MSWLSVTSDTLVWGIVALACAYVFHTWHITRKAKASGAGCSSGGECSTCGACNALAEKLAIK
jgi:hypothetical protein